MTDAISPSERNVSSGAHPEMTFPNTHLASSAAKPRSGSGGSGGWAAPEASAHNPVEELRQAVVDEDWARVFAEHKSKMQAKAEWSATKERCSALQCLCTLHRAGRVLEIGSFCGVAALAMAEAVPKDGEVVALELEPFFVEFGHTIKSKSQFLSKVHTKVGPAAETLKELNAQAKGGAKPFDFVVVDGDKASMKEYLELVRAPGMLSDKAVVCMDVTPFKGQPPTRFVKFGAEEKWDNSSGEEEIAALQAFVAASLELVAHEFNGLLVIQTRPVE